MLEKKELAPSPLANAYASLKQSTKVKQARTILLKTIATRREIDLNSEYGKDSWRFRAESRRRGLVDGKVLRGDMDAKGILAKSA